MRIFFDALINWIEENLNNDISIDKVVMKSGYSKWHLQRLFSRYAGISLGSYIRRRKLSEAALRLKLTTMSIIDIAEFYGFSSQQVFTRTFKHQFCFSPARYRRNTDWSFHGFYAGLKPLSILPPVKEVAFIPPASSRLLYSYVCLNEKISDSFFHAESRKRIFMKAQKALFKDDFFYILEGYEKPESCCAVKYHFSFHTLKSAVPAHLYSNRKIQQYYLSFDFSCNHEGIFNMRNDVYGYILPNYSLIRRKGCDVIIINTVDGESLCQAKLTGSYLIPIFERRAEFHE